jgi:hypothetical protein
MFAAAERLDLEGIVAKRKADPYRPETVWYKIKSRTYTQGEGRWELFQKRGCPGGRRPLPSYPPASSSIQACQFVPPAK